MTAGHQSLDNIRRQLSDLRGRIRRWFLIDGLAKVGLTILALVFVDFWIDRLFRMDQAQRFVMLLIMLGVVGYVAWRFLWKPLKASVTDDALLLQVEQQNPALHERLINAFQLARVDPEESYASPALLEKAIADGVSEAEQVQFANVLHYERGRKNLGLFAAAALGLLILLGSFAFAQPMRTWFNRNVMLGQAQWPQDYYLHVLGAEDNKLLVPRGEDWPIIVNVEKVLSTPESLQLEYDNSQSVRREIMNRIDKLSFESTLRDVQSEYRFRIVGRKGVASPWITIKLVERPEVVGTTLEASPPEYTKLETAELPPGAGPYYVLDGTKIRIAGVASKELRGAELLHENQIIPLQVDDDKNFSGEITPEQLKAGVYTISLLGTDEIARPGEDGLIPLRSSDTAQFTLRTKEDKAPKIKAKTSGISNLVVADALVPYKVNVVDDFAVEKLELDTTWNLARDDGTSTNGSSRADTAGIGDQLGQPEINSEGAFELGLASAPEGARVALQFLAEDNNTVNGPSTGASQVVFLRVVSPVELREDILRRNKEIRQRMDIIRKKQNDIGTDILALKADARDVDTMTDRQRLQLNKAQKEQKLLGSQMMQLHGRLDQIASELLNNHLEDENSALIGRLRRDILAPMETLAQTTIPAAADFLDGIRRVEGAEPRATAFETAGATNGDILTQMDEILKFMEKNEDFQLAVNLLHEIRKAQEGVRKRTESERKRRIKDLIEKQKGGTSE